VLYRFIFHASSHGHKLNCSLLNLVLIVIIIKRKFKSLVLSNPETATSEVLKNRMRLRIRRLPTHDLGQGLIFRVHLFSETILC